MNSYVTKDNLIIQKAVCRLTMIDLKLLAFICSHLKVDRSKQPLLTYDFKYSDIFKELKMNTSGRSYRYIRASLEHLKDSDIVFNERLNISNAHWLDDFQADKNINFIRVNISANIIPYLFNLRSYFTKYNVFNIYNVSSMYSIRLYELLVSYKNLKEKVFSLDDLKFLLYIKDKKGYKNFGQINDRILKTAMKEINEKTDIKINYIPIKEGRKYAYIAFSIKDNPQKSNMASESETDYSEDDFKCFEDAPQPNSFSTAFDNVMTAKKEVLQKSVHIFKKITKSVQSLYLNMTEYFSGYCLDFVDELSPLANTS